MITDRQSLYVFDDVVNARIFVQRLALMFWHIAIFIDEEAVIVIDGADESRAAAIRQLARTSGSIPAAKP